MKKFIDGYLALINKLLPAEKKEHSSVGVDIGQGSIKVVELVKSGNSYEMISWGIQPVEGGDIAKSLEKALRKTKHSTKLPYTAVAGKGTLIRYIPMPRMPLEDLKQSLAIEADKYFPFAQDQIYTDCFITKQQGDDKKMRVMVAASKREIVDERIKMLQGLGLQPEFVGLNPVAIANAFHILGVGSSADTGDKEKGQDVTPTFAVLDVGDKVSNLTVLENGVPAFTRDIYAGGRDLTQRITNAMDIDANQAEELKRNPGDKMEDIINACESTLSNMVGEMRLSFDYYTTEYNTPISKLYITGGGSLLKGLNDYFAKNLEIDVAQWDPLENLAISDKIKDDELQSSANRLGVAIGLALYQFA